MAKLSTQCKDYGCSNWDEVARLEADIQALNSHLDASLESQARLGGKKAAMAAALREMTKLAETEPAVDVTLIKIQRVGRAALAAMKGK